MGPCLRAGPLDRLATRALGLVEQARGRGRRLRWRVGDGGRPQADPRRAAPSTRGDGGYGGRHRAARR
jgi:hypothetical protein